MYYIHRADDGKFFLNDILLSYTEDNDRVLSSIEWYGKKNSHILSITPYYLRVIMARSSWTLSLAIRLSIALYVVLSFLLFQQAHVNSPQDIATVLSQRKQAFLGGSDNDNGGYSGTRGGSIGQQQLSIQNALHRPVAEILNNPKLPDWVKNYVEWHKRQRKQYFDDMRTNATSDVRFLISRCLQHDQCGGASDRLQDMPYNIMLANQTNRVLLVRWEKPARLENFLIPPQGGGIDWSVPDDMFPEGEKNWHLRGKEDSEHKIVSTIRRDSAAPIFKAYEKDVVGHRM
jgi:hypothetical protein